LNTHTVKIKLMQYWSKELWVVDIYTSYSGSYQYLDRWLSDLLLKLLEVEGARALQCPMLATSLICTYVTQVSEKYCPSDVGWQTPTRIVFSPFRDSFRWQMYNAGPSGCLQTLRCMLDQWFDFTRRSLLLSGRRSKIADQWREDYDKKQSSH